MKSALWLAVGVGLGFVLAHQVNRTPAGREFFADLDARTREFTGGIADGYRARDAELRDGSDMAAGEDAPGAGAVDPGALDPGATRRRDDAAAL